MTKNKITLRLPADAFQFLNSRAVACDCSPTKMAEQIIIQALKPGRKTIEDCLLEVSANSGAATLELARIILSESPDEYQQYQKTVLARTEAGILKFKRQINEG